VSIDTDILGFGIDDFNGDVRSGGELAAHEEPARRQRADALCDQSASWWSARRVSDDDARECDG
jgi:hypothetical protein